jgi:uncharacterized membrane protein YhaH (DUF805 family)
MRTWRRGFEFAGCSSPREFWLFTFVTTSIVVILCVCGYMAEIYVQLSLYMTAAAIALFAVVPLLAVAIRRVRDAGRSPWLLLIPALLLLVAQLVLSYNDYIQVGFAVDIVAVLALLGILILPSKPESA